MKIRSQDNNQLPQTSWAVKYLTRAVQMMAGTFLFILGPLLSAETLESKWTPIFKASLPEKSDAIPAPTVEQLVVAWENSRGQPISPGQHRRVAIKLDTQAGIGLSTPPDLVLALCQLLEERGYQKEEIFLIDLEARSLRSAGYLPPLSQGGSTWNGYPVVALEDGQYYREDWYYDSALPDPMSNFSPFQRDNPQENAPEETQEDASADDRKSFLPTILFLETDFWVNLPVITDHPALGINGVLANMSLWSASNTLRFLRSPGNAAVAATEIAAIPELLNPLAFTILSLQGYQFIGGPEFRSLYTVNEPALYLSADPLALEAIAWNRIEFWRDLYGFPALEGAYPILTYATMLGIGSTDNLQDRTQSIK